MKLRDYPHIQTCRKIPASLISFLKSYSQDIEPRRWTPTPLGTHVIGLGYVYQSGDILFDPALQAEDVKLDMHAFAAVYGKTPGRTGRI